MRLQLVRLVTELRGDRPDLLVTEVPHSQAGRALVLG
jgi:hypothetical protein